MMSGSRKRDRKLSRVFVAKICAMIAIAIILRAILGYKMAWLVPPSISDAIKNTDNRHGISCSKKLPSEFVRLLDKLVLLRRLMGLSLQMVIAPNSQFEG